VKPEVSVPRKALGAITLAAALFAAVIVQLTVVNRLPLPGAAAPDLVLALVTAIAVTTTPAIAAITGFAGGLALDIAPPAAHYAGEYALIFCLACYAAARVHRAIISASGEHDPVTAFTIMVAATAAGEAGKAALGMLLSDPNVTTAAVSRVLPGAILYDLVLSPFVFLLVARIRRGVAAGRAPLPEFSGEQRLASVFRQASVGAAPNLRLTGTGAAYGTDSRARRLPHLRFSGTGAAYGPRSPARRLPHLRFSGTGKNYVHQPVAGRVPKLRLSSARSGAIPAAAAAFSSSTPFPVAGGRTRKLKFAGDLPVPSARAVRTPGKNWLRSATSPALTTAKRPSRGPARGWLGSTGGGLTGRRGGIGAGRRGSRLAGRHGTGLAGGRKSARPRGFARGTLGHARGGAAPIAPRFPRTAAEALAARSAPSGLSALSGVGTPLAGGRSPQAGWLRSSRTVSALPVKRSPRRGWLGSSRRRPRTVIGSGVGGRARRYSAAPSGAWLRRSHHPWRKRSQRLLRMMGVGS
jgi:rod shape-determining protein MreD